MNRILSWLLRLAALSAVVAVAWVVYLDTKPRQAPVQVAEPQTGLSVEAEMSTAAESVRPQQPIVRDEESAPGKAAEEAVAAAPEEEAVTPPAASLEAGPETAVAPPSGEAAEEAVAAAPEEEAVTPPAASAGAGPETAAAPPSGEAVEETVAAAPEAEAVTPPAASAGAGPETAVAPPSGEATEEAVAAAPETAAPETAAPETAAPETAAPETAAPETAQPLEGAPGAAVRDVEQAAAPAESAETVVASVTESVAEPSGMESGQPAGEAGQTASAQEPQQDFMARWQSARMAAWQGRLDEAEALLQALHEERPDDYDLSGELGNVQFALGHLADAAQSYFMTSLRLAADGYDVDAVRLMWTVKRLDPELGTRLEHDLLGETAPAGEPGESAAGSD
jgi:hypothetical protein